MAVIRENGQLILHIKNNGLIDYASNPRHQQLSEFWNAKDESAVLKLVTPAWKAQTPFCDRDSQLACASFLRATMKEEHYSTRNPFQLMGVYACANLADVCTKNGQRLFVGGVLRDWSGWVPVSFLDSCALTLLQCSSKEEVEQKMADHSLSATSEQLNVRGVKIGVDYHIVQISVCESFMGPTNQHYAWLSWHHCAVQIQMAW